MAETADKLSEFTLALAEIYGGVKTAEAQAEKAAFDAQFQALKTQQEAVTFDSQSLRQPLAAGVGVPTGNIGTLLLLAVVGLSVYLVAK